MRTEQSRTEHMSSATKRPFESKNSEPNGRGKWRKTAAAASASQATAGAAVVFRVLCPVTKSGSVIGKGGGIISRIRQETGAKIRMEEIIPGCEERLIVISGPEKDSDVSNEHPKEVDKKAVSDENNGEKEKEKEKEEEEGSKSEKSPSSAQKALLLIFERIIEEEEAGEEAADDDEDGDEESKQSTVYVRLLIASSQVGCLLGKGGSIIKQMMSDTAAQIRVLPRDKLPAFASAHDGIVQVL